MKNHLTVLGLSLALCTFVIAQANVKHHVAPTGEVPGFYQDQQDTTMKKKKDKMHKKDWKKKDSTRTDTTRY